MHMAWVRQVAGRLKSDYRYSNKLVYNNFPWPSQPTGKQALNIEALSQRVLEVRARLGDGRVGYLPARKPGLAPATLADLYDPLTMPPDLLKAHQNLDRAVDRCYRDNPFTSDRERVEFLFARYEQLTAPLLPSIKPRRTSRRLAK